MRNPNLVDKSREFLIEVTVYGQADSDDSSGIELVGFLNNKSS